MRLCRFVAGAEHRYGVVLDNLVHDVTVVVAAAIGGDAGAGPGDPVLARLDDVREAIERASLGEGVSLDEVQLLSPILSPTKIIAAPVNYHSHRAEVTGDLEINNGQSVGKIDELGLFLKATTSLVGAGEGIALRFPERRTDHEVEIGVVIGAECSRVRPEHALSYVAGYAIALDITLRGTEDRSFRKSIDTYSVLGPCLVTTDEVPESGALDFALRVNGEQRQASNTRMLIRDIPSLISWASEWYTLYPGDVLMTGTPEGVAPLAPGDVLLATADRLGALRISVRSADESA